MKQYEAPRHPSVKPQITKGVPLGTPTEGLVRVPGLEPDPHARRIGGS